jgi:hypothetical protein
MAPSTAGLICAMIVAGMAGLAGCADTPTQPVEISVQDMYPPELAWPGPNFLDNRLAGCPTAAEIASVGAVDLTFEETALAGPLVCRASDGSADLTGFQKEGYFALILMKQLRFSRDLPWTSATLYEWFLSTNTSLTFVGASSASRYDNGRILIYLGATPPSEVRWTRIQGLIAVLAHENRHAEGPRHTCGNKDRSIADRGAFAYHNDVYTWIGLYSDPSVIPESYRPHALQTACSQQNGAFCLDPKKSCR